VKRLAITLAVLLAVSGVSYAVGVARQEAVYRAYIEQGDTALSRDDSVAAIEAFTTAISHKAESMAAHLKRGEAYRRRGEFENALRDLGRAAELDPLSPHPREILGDVNYAMGRYPVATERYRESLRLDDRSPRVVYKLALSHVKLGQPAPAVALLRQALGMDDQFAEAHYLLGICLRDLQRHTEALEFLERAVSLNRTFVKAHEELADAYGRLGRFGDRNRHLEALTVLDPGARREVALGLGYARDGQVERAVLRLGVASRQFPDEPQAFVALGRLWLDRAEHGGGRVELSKAIGALESAVGNHSTSEAHTLYGRALMLSGELGRAERALEYAASRTPVDPLAFYYLADVAERRGHVAVAQRALIDYAALQGIDSGRLDARLLARLAEAYLGAGDVIAARQTLARADQKDPDNPHVRALTLRLAR
jgi:tetratricopeptide (TPR) repeat protein